MSQEREKVEHRLQWSEPDDIGRLTDSAATCNVGTELKNGETDAPAMSMLRLPNKQSICCCYCVLLLLAAAIRSGTRLSTIHTSNRWG